MFRIFSQGQIDKISDMILSTDEETRKLASMLLRNKKRIQVTYWAKTFSLIVLNVSSWILVDLYIHKFHTVITMLLIGGLITSLGKIVDLMEKAKGELDKINR